MPQIDSDTILPNEFFLFANLELLVNEDFAIEAMPDATLGTSAIIEDAIQQFFFQAGLLPRTNYRIVVLPSGFLAGSLLVDLGIFIAFAGAAITPFWMFLRDYEKVRSGLVAFVGDLKRLLNQQEVREDVVPAEKIEPVELSIAESAEQVIDRGVTLKIEWKTNDEYVLSQITIPRTGGRK